MLGPFGLDADVLDEGAAECDVQYLDAPAGAEDRQLALERAAHQLELEGVPVGLGGREMLRRLLAEEARLDVPPAAEKDPIAGVQGVVEEGSVQPRERHRHAACKRDRALEADASVVTEVVQADREADHRLLLHSATYTGRLESPHCTTAGQ